MPDDTKAQTIKADAAYYVTTTCPQCGQEESVPLTLLARVDKTREGAKLGLKVAQKALDHQCSQMTLTVVSETGEIVTLGGDQ